MKDKKFKKLIQKPLRFHHQDIHEELQKLEEKLNYVIGKMQVLSDRVDELNENTMLWLHKYDDPY
jgi:predicted nuclease with TOPRIM domain